MKQPKYATGLSLILFSLIFLALISINDTLGFFLILAVLGLSAGALLHSLVRQIKSMFVRHARGMLTKDFSFKLTATVMGFLLVVGTGLYYFVFWKISLIPDDHRHYVQFTNIESFIRSLICSLDLFMLDVEGSILDKLSGEPVIKAWIAVHAVLCFSCTVAMLIGLVYSRLNAYYKLSYRTNITNSRNHLYLFFGINDPSEALIKDIVKNDEKAVIVMIDEAAVNEDYKTEWDGIIGLVAHKPKTFEIAGKYSARAAVASKPLCEIDGDITSLPYFDAFGYLGLSHITKLINKLKKTEDPQLHIFFLNENESRNIRDIITLAKDKTIMSVAQSDIRHRIYCHARFNGPNRVIQDVALKKNLNIKIIDSSHIAVERLKLLPEYHPYHVVEMDSDNPCTVKDDFDALIVGFGEVGRDAFRFLYEFSAFVDNNATCTSATRCGFRCTIVDKDIDKIKGAFKAAMPGIFKDKTKSVNIDFKSMDYNHDDFYDTILDKDRIARLNYVVISIGNNDEAIALAARIFNRFRQYGGDLGKLMILVRCSDDAKVETVQKIADHYNYGYGAGESNRPVIRIFGQPEETYTYELVVSNRLVELGKVFSENYRQIKGEGPSWDERHASFTHTLVPNIDKLRKMRRQESQDMANALHIHTKMAFFYHAMPKPLDWTGFLVRYFKYGHTPYRTGSKTGITYPALSERENLIILRLAMLEHLRWNAAHELLGYVCRRDGVAACDEQTMRHNCLKNWNELDAESKKTEEGDWPCDYKEYDFAVVDTSMALSDLNKIKDDE